MRWQKNIRIWCSQRPGPDAGKISGEMTSDGKPIIGMMLETAFPPDIRVEKEARALVAAGYEVHLLSVGDGQRPENGRYISGEHRD